MISFSKLKAWRASSLITLGIAGLLFGATDSRSQAQQEPNRQLVQTGSNASAGKRIALVIGNGAYQNAKPLKNPANDATVMAASLRELGFEVVSGVNLTQREMKQMMREFGRHLRAQNGVGVFYYAGHGVQAKGHNYLVPVDAEVQSEADMEDAAVDMNYILGLMDDAQNTLNIVILDACRNNPFSGRSFRSTADGLAQVKAPSGTLIAYATAPDNIASDGPGDNGLYTEELLKTMKVPGVLVETMFRRVAEQVSGRTSGRQEPWFSANVKGDFYFKAAASDVSRTTARSRPSATLADATTVEAEYWESIKESKDKTDFRDYLKEYPQGRYAPLARVKLRPLEPPTSTATDSQSSNSGNKSVPTDSSLTAKNTAAIPQPPQAGNISVPANSSSTTRSARDLFAGTWDAELILGAGYGKGDVLTFTLRLDVTGNEVTGELIGRDATCHLYAGSASEDKISFKVAEPCVDKHGEPTGSGVPFRTRKTSGNSTGTLVVHGFSEFTASVSNNTLTGQVEKGTWSAKKKR